MSDFLLMVMIESMPGVFGPFIVGKDGQKDIIL